MFLLVSEEIQTTSQTQFGVHLNGLQNFNFFSSKIHLKVKLSIRSTYNLSFLHVYPSGNGLLEYLGHAFSWARDINA